MIQVGLFLAILFACLLLLLAYQWAVTGDPFQDPRLSYWPFDRPGFGEEVGLFSNAFRLVDGEEGTAVLWYHDAEQPPRGHTPARGLYNTEQNWRSLENRLFGWPAIFTVAFCWLAFLARRPGWRDMMLLATAGGLVGAYVLFWSSGIMYGPRSYYAAMPAFLLLTARGVQAAGDWLGRSGSRVMMAVTAILVMGNALFYLPNAIEGHREYNFVSGGNVAQVEERIQGKGILFVTTNALDWWDYGNFFSSNSPWLDGRIIYARDLGDEQNERLLRRYPGYQGYRWQDGRLAPLSQTGAQG
jgi:hypothetical protein